MSRKFKAHRHRVALAAPNKQRIVNGALLIFTLARRLHQLLTESLATLPARSNISIARQPHSRIAPRTLHLTASTAASERSEQQSTLKQGVAMLAALKTQRPKKHVHWDIEDCECEKLTKAHELEETTQHRPRYFNINFWFLTTVLLLAFLIVQNVPDLRSRGLGSYEKGFTTDFPDAHRTVGLEQRRFTSSLRDYPNGTLYMVSDASQDQYVGLPSPGIDGNWDALTHGRVFTIFTTPPTNLVQDVTFSSPRPRTLH